MRRIHLLHPNTSIVYADDVKEDIALTVRLRLPWLALGLLGGAAVTFIISQFEAILSQNIALAFFIPFMVYMSDAVETQTETIYVRNLSRAHANFSIYLIKEIGIGIALGTIFGFAVGLFAQAWIGDPNISFTVGLAMFANIAMAPILGIILPQIFMHEHTDPAIAAGPVGTIIQDFLSVVIYFLIASFILFR